MVNVSRTLWFIISIIKGLDNLDENSGAGSDDESVYDKSYIDLPHSANPGKTKSIHISIKGKLKRDKQMRTFLNYFILKHVHIY